MRVPQDFKRRLMTTRRHALHVLLQLRCIASHLVPLTVWGTKGRARNMSHIGPG